MQGHAQIALGREESPRRPGGEAGAGRPPLAKGSGQQECDTWSQMSSWMLLRAEPRGSKETAKSHAVPSNRPSNAGQSLPRGNALLDTGLEGGRGAGNLLKAPTGAPLQEALVEPDPQTPEEGKSPRTET